MDDEARYYAQLGEQELLRVSHITRQTLSFYRESQQAVPVSIPELLDNVLELQARRLQLNGITLGKKYENTACIHGFPVELKQVFLNLIGNAVQAMPEGGRLRIHVHESIDWKTFSTGVCISVGDTGSGISPEHARRLFEPLTGLLAGVVLASSVLFCGSAHFANPDALLNASTVLTFLFFMVIFIIIVSRIARHGQPQAGPDPERRTADPDRSEL